MSGSNANKHFIRASFAEVIEAQSCRYEVAAVVVERVMKAVKNFHKVIALLMDEKQNRMWCEAIGNKEEMEKLVGKLKVESLVLCRSLVFRRSQYHSGGRYLDLTRKQKVVLEALPPTDSGYAALKRAFRKGPDTPGEISHLQGLQNGNKADLTCKLCEITHRKVMERQAGNFHL